MNQGNSAEFAVEIQQVVKHYGTVKALEDVSLTIQDNEFFTMLGPSGCGKTTLLRVIAVPHILIRRPKINSAPNHLINYSYTQPHF